MSVSSAICAGALLELLQGDCGLSYYSVTDYNKPSIFILSVCWAEIQNYVMKL